MSTVNGKHQETYEQSHCVGNVVPGFSLLRDADFGKPVLFRALQLLVGLFPFRLVLLDQAILFHDDLGR